MSAAAGQRGAITIMLALLLVAMLALMGFSLDLARAYDRRVELQALADATALTAARSLDGSLQGIANAASNAEQVVAGNRYQSRSKAFAWSDDLLRFSEDPDAAEADWLEAGAIDSSRAARIRYARIDTAGISDGTGEVRTTFLNLLRRGHHLALRAVAVAGRESSQVAPLGVCAMNPTRYTQRVHNAGVNNELVEHGFRRGVGYNLLNLNPDGPTAVNFLVNPVDVPPQANNSSHFANSFVAPYLCTGTMSVPANGELYVSQPFPATLIGALNARFNQYGSGLCNAVSAPPDLNLRVFNGLYGGWWMNAVPAAVSAKSVLQNNKLVTIADAAVPSPLPSNTDMGTLWAFSRPVAYDPSKPNFAGAPFVRADWPFLYPTNPAAQSSFALDDPLPYLWHNSPHLVLSPVTAHRNRRILYIPLLACPVSGSKATVLAVGKFLMTAPATSTPLAVHAEFGGLIREGELLNSVVLYK